MLTDAVSELETAILLQTDFDNDIVPDIWQVPLLVSQSSCNLIFES